MATPRATRSLLLTRRCGLRPTTYPARSSNTERWIMRKLLPALILALMGRSRRRPTTASTSEPASATPRSTTYSDPAATSSSTTPPGRSSPASVRSICFAVEANYMDLGDESVSFGLGSARAGRQGIRRLRDRLPADSRAFPRHLRKSRRRSLGAGWQTERRRAGATSSDDGTEFAWGGGAQVRFGSLGARLEYDHFDIDNTDGLDLYTLGVTWTFL